MRSLRRADAGNAGHTLYLLEDSWTLSPLMPARARGDERRVLHPFMRTTTLVDGMIA